MIHYAILAVGLLNLAVSLHWVSSDKIQAKIDEALVKKNAKKTTTTTK